jgi:hypothetical protein
MKLSAHRLLAYTTWKMGGKDIAEDIYSEFDIATQRSSISCFPWSFAITSPLEIITYKVCMYINCLSENVLSHEHIGRRYHFEEIIVIFIK